MKRFLLSTLLTGLCTLLWAQTNLTLQLHPTIGGAPFTLFQNFSEYAGRTANVTRLQYYLCNFELIHDGGQVTPLTNTYLLVNTTRTDYDLGSASVTNVEQIRFSVGVDATVNHNDPSLWPSSHPLALQTPSMHWGWQAGYKFAAIEGQGDQNNDGTPETIWQLHPTGDQMIRTLTVNVSPNNMGGVLYLPLEYDIQAWLRDIHLPTAGIDHGTTGDALTLMNNLNTYQVFTGIGAVNIQAPIETTHLYFDLVEADRPIIYWDSQIQGPGHTLRIHDLNGRTVFTKAGLSQFGNIRVADPLAKGMYICTLLHEDKPLLTKKFQITR